MASNLGFVPVQNGKRYYVSYNNIEAQRIGIIAQQLNEMGVPLCYDYHMEKAGLSAREVSRNIRQCEAVILFITKSLFAKENIYLDKEIKLAKIYNKTILPIWIDNVKKEDVNKEIADRYIYLVNLHGIFLYSIPTDQLAQRIVNDLGLIHGMTPQPLLAKDTSDAGINEQEPDPVYQIVKNQKKRKVRMAAAIVIVLLTAIVGTVWALKSRSYFPDTVASDSDTGASDVNGESHESNTTEKNIQIDISALSEYEVVQSGNHYLITMGHYKQGSNGEIKPIEWRVLAIQDGQALLLSEKLLDYAEYGIDYYSSNWKDCILRQWLNDTFLNEAFNRSEQNKIVLTTIDNPNNSVFGTEGDSPTQDRIFALSEKEAETYFVSDSDRIAYTTDYAHSKGNDKSDRSDYWWLRTPGGSGYETEVALHNGSIHYKGAHVFSETGAVRPAMWIKI